MTMPVRDRSDWNINLPCPMCGSAKTYARYPIDDNPRYSRYPVDKGEELFIECEDPECDWILDASEKPEEA